MRPVALHTKNLCIGYPKHKDKDALLQEDINLSLNRGEITCLLGPNGTGKSTLIRTIAGFQKPLKGHVFLDNVNIDGLSPSELARKVSVVLTEQVFVGNMSVFDMVAYGRAPYTGFLGKLRERDGIEIENAMNKTGIAKLHNRRYFELSDGEKQKVMIAKSLAQETPAIFLDEPTAFLDFPSKIEILQLLRKTSWEQNKAILLSTHDLNLAIRFADKIWLMGKDKPMQSGVPEDLIISGQIGEFFDRGKTRFDVPTGNFEFEAEPVGNVMVAGRGTKFDWLKKALIRKGFQINGSNIPVAMIEVLDDVFLVKVNSTVFRLRSVFEILERMAAIKTKNPG
jgi:iron complex transport system ATP-binding protein